MRMLLAILVLLLVTSLTITAEPSDQEPLTPESKALGKLLDSIGEGKAEAAQRAYDRLTADFSGKEVADEAAWHFAYFQFRQRNSDKGQDLFLSLKRSGRKNRWVSLALIALADDARERGDERAMLCYLEELLTERTAPTGRNATDMHDTRQEAFIRLARHYRDKGDFKKALDYYTRWEPQSSCGNCQASMKAEREQEIMLCRVYLGDHVAVIRESFRQLRKEDWVSNLDAWVLWSLYREAGQVGDLREMLDDYEKHKKERPREEEHYPSPTHGLRGLLQVQALAEKKDVAALVNLCREKIPYESLDVSRGGRGDLIRSAAAEALAKVGGAEVESTDRALAERPKVTGWLIYALGRSSAPSALDVLRKAAEQEVGDEESFTHSQNVAYALALKGEPGNQILKRLALQKSEIGDAARVWLRRKAEPIWPAPTWPAPRAGSLPKTMLDSR
jgi:hypothetical protein